VLCGFIDTGAGIETVFSASRSLLVDVDSFFIVAAVSNGALSTGVFSIPFVDATELLSPFESLEATFRWAGLFLPISAVPLIPPLVERILPFRDDR
jgi:hypothetical protein